MRLSKNCRFCADKYLAPPFGRGVTANAVTERADFMPSQAEIKDFGQLPHRGSQGAVLF